LALPQEGVSSPDDARLETVVGNGFRLDLPPSYYRPQGRRPKTGTFDDNIFVAADYASSRTVSVSRTDAASLILDSGDPIAPQSGPLVEFNELGRPFKVATLLTRRREGDPQGSLAQPRSEVVSVSREGNELRFVLRELTYTQTGVTAAKPSARYTWARSLFVPGRDQSLGRSPYLLTVWASSPAPSASCLPVRCDCGEGSSLSCDCPAPKCEDGSDALQSSDGLERKITDSLVSLPNQR